MAAKKGRKRIKRRPGQKSVMYFTKDTEVSIVKFLTSEEKKEREQVYGQEILPAMKKLVESLIYVYGFKSPLMNTQELIEEGCFFLYKSLHKWDPAKGSKAFSYFNVVAKNFLINTTNSHRKKYFKHVYLDEVTSRKGDSLIKQQIDRYVELPSTEELIINSENRAENIARVKKVREHLSDDRDLITISAVEKLFDNAQELDFINKQSIYIYLCEISGLEKKHLTKSMSKIRKIYSRLVVEEKEKGGL
tara:strand:- start:1521 stop:2264 length:744 start_codon:yes stop_codon:yes gene_type:complete